MIPQHLSDEAVAAFADGVLTGHARTRAGKHTAECAECAHAVRVQREAAFALRAALPPPVPNALMDRLRGVPQHTPIKVPPTVLAEDGSPMIATFGAPMAAIVPTAAAKRTHHPFAAGAAVVVLAGALATGVVISDSRGTSPSDPPVQLTRIVPGVGR